MEPTQIMQGNLSIDFTKKNNPKPPLRPSSSVQASPQARAITSPQARAITSPQARAITSPQARAITSSQTRPMARPQSRPTSRPPMPAQKMTSEAFLRHRQVNAALSIDDQKKLIKKDEVPVRIVSLLGIEQVGQCMFVEYKNDIIIVDIGMEFAANEEMGADYIIPDISYLKKNKHKIRGILITHGHLDHVGAIRNIVEDLDYPTIYASPLSIGIIKKTFDEPKKANLLKYKLVDPDSDFLKLGCFNIEFIRVNHNIPESMSISIQTPKGVIFDSGDFKIDYTPSIDRPTDLAKIARIGTEGVKLYIGDSLGSQTPGRAKSEKIIGETIDQQIKNVKGRMVIASFASNIGRVIQIVNSAIKYNKVVFLSGRSLVNNIEICQELGYITVPKGMIRKLDDDVNNMPEDRVLMLCTGAQGEEFAALTRMSRGEHAQVQLKKGDTVLMSSSTIPGNELAINKMINNLLIQGVELITNNDMDVHTSGHGYAEDHKLFLSLIKPQYFMPFFDDMAHRYAHKKLGLDLGVPETNILMPVFNGSIIEMYDEVVLLSDKQMKLDTILIDGKGQGHMSGEYVIKARHIMAQSGIVSLIFKVDTKNQELVGNIQIESRGFVYSSEVKTIHTQIVDFARARYNENLKKRMEVKLSLKMIKDDLGEYINKIIGRVPMVMPMFVYINRDPQNQNGDLSVDEAIVGMTLEEQGYDD